jgi:hypothetical protein
MMTSRVDTRSRSIKLTVRGELGVGGGGIERSFLAD